MAKYLPDSEVFGSAKSGYISEDEVLGTSKPESRSIVDIVSGGIKAVADDVTSGLAARKKAKRDEEMARANEASQAMIADQQASGTYDELQRRADQIAASNAAKNSVVQGGIDLARDTGVNLVRGVADIGQAATGFTGGVIDAAGTAIGMSSPLNSLAKIGVDFREASRGFDQFDKWAAGYLSDTGKSKEAKLEATKGFTDTLLTLGTDPRLMLQEITKSLPGTLMAGKVGEAAVGVYGSRFAAEAKNLGLTGEAAQGFIAKAFADNADKITRAAMIGSAAGEGLQQTGGLAGKAQAHDIAFKDYAGPAVASGVLDAAISLGSNKLANKIGIGDIETDIALRKTGIATGKTTPAFWMNRGVIEGFKEGAFEELPQSVQEAIAENLAFGRPWDQGIGKAAAQGLATGFGMGGGHALISRPNEGATGGAVPSAPSSGAVDAADLLGTPEQFNRTDTIAPTEADKALYTPKKLTALDRVNEIDAKLAESDNPSSPALQTERAALQSERDSITASWPKYVVGDPTTVTLPSGSKVAAHWAVVDASEPAASHDIYGNENPRYDKELQPRERGDRHAYRLQVSKITQNLDPELLYESPLAGTGAPILRADGPVVDGNGRESAIQAAYQSPGAKADLLRAHVRANAPNKGIPEEAIAHIPNPQFVRVIDHGQGIDYVEFSRQANGSIAARMSPSEQAKSDAAQIDNMDDLNPTESGDFASSTSDKFVQRFLSRIGAAEQAGLVDATGQLSQAGYTRIRNAVLAKAYGDSPVLLRMVESLDDNSRNVSKALLRVAPQVAKAREGMREGALHDVDLIPDLMAAVQELSDLKDKGTSVDEALAQAGMFGDKLSPESRQLLALLSENARSPRRIADFIQAYLDALTAAGNPGQGSMFGDNAAPSKDDLMTAARRTSDANTATRSADAGNSKDAEKSGSQSENAPGDQAGHGRNEAARTDQQLIDELNKLNPQLNGRLTVEWVEPGDPRTANVNDGDAASFVGGHNGSSIILVKGKANRRTLLHEIRHMIDMLLGGYQLRKWLAEDSDLMKRMVAYLRDERKAGRIDKDSRMTDAEETAQSVLDAYYQDKERLRESFPDVVEYLEKMGADKYAGLMQEVGAGETAKQDEWLNFPPDTGTLGIPRAEMPQVKGEHRGALIQFLDGLGITHKTVEMPASKLKPTQAEFSTKKAEGWKEVREGSDRSVLASSDGYILDGHHQWVAALANGETEQVIQFDAPIKELLAATFRFPSVRQSEGANVVELRAKARQDFKDALADLAQIATKHTRAAMLPEDTPNLMPTLIKLSEAAIAEVGYQIKDIIAHVKRALKSNAEFKKLWNKIDNAIYRKAAEKAAEQASMARVDDLFSMAEERKGQGDLFSQPPAKKTEKAAEDDGVVGLRIANELAAKWQKELGDKIKVVMGGSLISGTFVQTGNDPIDMDVRFLSDDPKGAVKDIERVTGLKLRKTVDASNYPVGTSTAYMIEGFITVDGKEIEVEGQSRNKAYVGWANYYKQVFSEKELADFRKDKVALKGDKKAYKARKNEMLQEAQVRAIQRGLVQDREYSIPASWKSAEGGSVHIDDKGNVRGKGLTSRERFAEQQFYDQINADPSAAVDKYLALFNNIVDADNAKELSAFYADNAGYANAVHEPSSALSKLIWTEALKRDKRTDVIFTAGGAGSGKSYSGALARKIAGVPEDTLTFDSALTNQDSAIRRIDASVADGRKVSVVYTNTPVEVAFLNSLGRKRLMPAALVARAHARAADTLRALKKHYADNESVVITVINNDGKGAVVVGTIDDIPMYDYNEVEGRLNEIAKQQNVAGKLLGAKFEFVSGNARSPLAEEGSGVDGRQGVGRGNLQGQGQTGGRVSEGASRSIHVGSGGSGGLNGQDREDGPGGAQGKESGAASTTGRPGQAQGVSDGSSGRDQQPDRDADHGTGGEAGARQGEEPGGRGGDSQGVRSVGDGNGAVRNAGLPAGRDIPAKTGRNYAFGDGDLTYAGSWHVKARQNVEAVELLKKLQTENRQASREEQATLAKFIGWGSSEIANSIFGDKLTKQLEALENYDEAIERLGDKPYLTNASHYNYNAAFRLLQAKNPNLNWYTAGNITKAMLDAAKPDSSVKKWAELRDRLKASMTEAEWDAASRSTQYAHYTSKPVVKALLGAVSKMGFKGGTILEPGAGIGVFPGLMSSDMATNSVYTGVEFDPITGGILKQLFPDERILVESFIDSKLPENFYDVAFGNPPFGAFKVLADPKYVKHAFALHDYFFAKSLDSVKPGGLLVFVTSRYTMDKKGDKARAYMAERADLVGAIRLPQTAFQKNAGTEVVTDILFLRKKVPGQTFDQAQPWMGLGEVKTDKAPALINEYFAAHPEMVMGTHARAGKMYSKDEYTVLPHGGDIEAQIAAAVENLPADVFVSGRGSAAEAAKVRDMDFNPKALKEGSFYISDAGVLMQREGGVGVRAEAKYQKDSEVLKDYVSLRDAVKQSQMDQLNDGDWETSLKALQKAYERFKAKHGRLLQNTTYMQKVKVDELDEDGTPTGNKVEDEEQRRRFPLLAKIKGDTEWTLVAELERLNEDTGEVKDSEWLTKRTLNKPTAAEVKTPADALLATLDDTGEIDMAAVAARIGLSEQETIDSLGSLVYQDPAQGWVMADEYLSGNVKKKLAEAEEAAKSDKSLARNVEALKAVQPSPRSPEQITPQIGMNWIPGEVYSQFLFDVTGVKAKIEYVKRTRDWVLTTISGEGTPQATSDWGVGDKANAGWLMEKALTGAAISLNKSVPDGKGGSKLVFDPDRTEAANEKRKALREKFREWLFQDAERTTKLVQLYNDKFNTTVQRKFDGTHLTLPGTSKLFNIFDHVKRGAWRVIQTGNTYLAHAVGSGKTFEMVISAMEQKRLGKIKKPMIIVPGHMLQQFASEWQQLYPTARLMVADETDFHTDNRRRFVSRVAMSDLDGVIMTHSSFGLLDLDPAFKQKMIEQELEVLRASYVEAGGDLDDIGDKKVRKDPKIKRIESQIEKLEQQLAKAMSSEGKDKNVRFDEMGVDFLYVDEAHLFRKLSFATARQTKGIAPMGSQMAWDLYMKTRWLAEKNPTRNLVMASGTAITNTTAELYTVQRFMAPQVLEENGLSGFDDWASQFGEESTTIESTASGKYEPVTRFQEFVNVGEMTQMFRDFADVLNEDQLAAILGDKRPKVKGGARKMVITPKTESYARFLKEDLAPRIETSKNWKPSFEEQFNPDPIIAINIDARLAAIDMRFMEPSLPNDPDSKLNQMIDGVIRIYNETNDTAYRGKSTKDAEGKEVLADFEAIKGSTQMVFFESGFGQMVAQRRGFNARAWMEKRLRDAGIPASQLAFMEDYKKSSAKLKLFSDVNKGKVRILVGSSAAMGTGVNAQQRLIALHHLDAPYVPATLEQREGRIVRQGNKNGEVQIYAYSTFGSFDENMWQMLARKKFFIEQAMSGDPNIRSIEDVGEVNQLQMAAGLVAENPFVMQLAGARADVAKMTRLYRNHEDQRARHREDYIHAGRAIEYNEMVLLDQEKAAARVKDLHGDAFTGKADGKDYATRKEWGAAILGRFKELSDKLTEKPVKVGELSGFDLMFAGELQNSEYRANIRLMTPIPMPLAWDAGMDPAGMAVRAVNALVEVAREPIKTRRVIEEAKAKRESLESRLDAPFPLAEQLANKVKEVSDLEDKVINYGKAAAPSFKFDADEWSNATTMFSRGTGRGMALRDLRAVVDRVSAGFKNLPRVHVMESPASLSIKDPAQKALRDYIRKSGAWDDVEGATHDGEIYLFASGMADEARAEHVLATHEVTHYGLRGAIGKDLDAALQHVLLMNAKVRKAAVLLKGKLGLKSNLDAVEEVLSDLTPADLVKLRGWRKVVQVVRDWLNRIGAKSMAARLDKWIQSGMSDQEKADLYVTDLVTAARDWVKKGKGKAVVPGTKLAEHKLSDDWAAQEKWLEKEAKARGYKSIDDLAEKAYPVFEKLAALWREKNPADALLSRSGGIRVTEINTKDITGVDHPVRNSDLRKIADAVLRAIRQEISEGKAPLVNAHTQWELSVASKDVGKMGNNPHMKPESTKATINAREIVRTAYNAESHTDTHGHGADMVHRLYAPVLIDGKLYRVRLTVLDYHETRGRRNLHAIRAVEIENALLGTLQPADAPEEAATAAQPTTGRTVTISDLLRGVKREDGTSMLSRASAAPIRNSQTANKTADEIINTKAATARPVDAVMKGATQFVRLDKLTMGAYNKAAALLDRYTPETIKAGMVSDYGIPEAVTDQRAIVQGRQKEQTRAAGALLEKLATLTRAESRVAYQWMNSDDPQSSDYFMAQLPPESIKTLAEVEKMIDDLSKEAVRLGQLSPDAYQKNRFAYLHRSYVKHTAELTKGEAAMRKRAIAILGDQYKGRGMTDKAAMRQIQNLAPEWWNRKTVAGKADKQLKGEQFIRLEKRAHVGAGTQAMPGTGGKQVKPKLLEVVYWPVSEPVPLRYGAWERAGTWEVRDTKGADLILWRDFTAQERQAMGEIDEVRYAIAKTLHGMIHDVETGKYLEWLGQNYAKKPGETIDGKVVEATDRMRDVYKLGEWVQVPATVIPGTQVKKYGTLAGRYLPGPIWNDVRQVVGFRYQPLGETYAAIHRAWKTSKTALSPAVHMNNVMANFVMADWHDVSAGHILKALNLMLSKDAAAGEVIARFGDSGGSIGTWAAKELQQEQLRPLLDALEKELGLAGNVAGQVGVMSALQLALKAQFPAAWEALKPSKAGQATVKAARGMLALYEAEDQVFRLAAWLKAKEEGATDLAAGKLARKSFLDYSINAPWVQMMRNTALPFVAFTYRAVPMMMETAAKKPWKLMKLGMLAGAINALGYMLSGGDEDDERRMLPEEKAGRVWGIVPKLIRMPWNDASGSPVFMDIRRWVPVGDVLDVGQSHSAIPLLPSMTPGGPLAVIAELALDGSQFTGKKITLETDTPIEKAQKIADHLFKAFAPNLPFLPGTYSFDSIMNAGKGKTDTFGREQSMAQAIVSSVGIKVGSYPKDVLQLNATREAQAKMMEIDHNITTLKREYQKHGLTSEEFQTKALDQMNKKRKVMEDLQKRMAK